MAEIIAEDDDNIDFNRQGASEEQTPVTIEDTLKPVQEKPETPEQPSEEAELPAKYKGKSIMDLVQMHQNAESALGRQSSEVGELRKVVDDFILSQSRINQKETAPKDDEPDFFLDPKKAVSKTVAESEVIRELQQELQVSRQERAINTMLKRHPKIKETLQDPKFAEWVQGKPHRLNLLQRTDQYDLDAADELLSLWGDYSGATNQAVQQQTRQQRSSAVQKANTGNIQSASVPGKRGPVFRRADIIKLRMEDPDRYEALEDEIMQAYAEKRVI